jgi:hypothetical protein
MAGRLSTIEPMGNKKPKSVQGKRPGRPVFVRLRPELDEALEAFLRSKRLAPSLTRVVEAALEDFLASQGFPPRPPDGRAS